MSTDRFEPVTDRDHGYSSFEDPRSIRTVITQPAERGLGPG